MCEYSELAINFQFVSGDQRLKMSLKNLSKMSVDLSDEPFTLWKLKQKVQYSYDVRGDGGGKAKCVMEYIKKK